VARGAKGQGFPILGGGGVLSVSQRKGFPSTRIELAGVFKLSSTTLGFFSVVNRGFTMTKNNSRDVSDRGFPFPLVEGNH
jgi:hypothetical protein